MFNNDAIKKMVDAVNTVENYIPKYRKSTKFKKWIQQYLKKITVKAVVEGIITVDDVATYLESVEVQTKLNNAIKNHLARIEKNIRQKYADELQAWEIIQKMPRYDKNEKIVIDI